MGKVIAVASGKGGVGKTTLVANIGVLLAGLDKRVLLVDADVAMANLTLLLNMASSPITLHDVLIGEATIQDAMYDYIDNVKVIPSSLSFESYARVDLDKLGGFLDRVRADFDYIILDCPAGVDKALIADLDAADELLLVVNPTSPSVADALKTKLIAERIGIPTLGGVINMVLGERGEIPENDIVKMLELPIFASVPLDDEVRKSFLLSKPKPIALRKSESPSVNAFKRVAARIAGVPVEAVKVKKTSLLQTIMGFFKKKK